MTFTILQVTSGYSLLRSTIDLYKYVMTAKTLGYQKLVLTDEGVLHGAIEFVVYSRLNLLLVVYSNISNGEMLKYFHPWLFTQKMKLVIKH